MRIKKKAGRPKKVPAKPKKLEEPKPGDSIFDELGDLEPEAEQLEQESHLEQAEPAKAPDAYEDYKQDPVEEPPEDFPEPDPVLVSQQPASLGRVCPDCGQNARIVSNDLGVQAYCGPCKKDWPIRPPGAVDIPGTMPRSLAKTTLVEPDYSMAWDDVPEDFNP